MTYTYTDLILVKKLKNRIKSVRPDLEEVLQYDIHNTKINGVTIGCSGFITNTDTGITVYVDTSSPEMFQNRVMYRVANDNKDFTGYENMWCKNNPDFLASCLLSVLCNNPYSLARYEARHRVGGGEDLYAQYRTE